MSQRGKSVGYVKEPTPDAAYLRACERLLCRIGAAAKEERGMHLTAHEVWLLRQSFSGSIGELEDREDEHSETG